MCAHIIWYVYVWSVSVDGCAIFILFIRFNFDGLCFWSDVSIYILCDNRFYAEFLHLDCNQIRFDWDGQQSFMKVHSVFLFFFLLSNFVISYFQWKFFRKISHCKCCTKAIFIQYFGKVINTDLVHFNTFHNRVPFYFRSSVIFKNNKTECEKKRTK